MARSDEKEGGQASLGVKLLSYIVAMLIAILTGSFVSSFNNILGWVFGISTFLLVSLSDIRSTLQILVEEVPSAGRAIVTFFGKPELTSVRKLIDLWHISLFKPIQYRLLRDEAIKKRKVWGVAEIYLKMSLLFLVNSFVFTLVLAIQKHEFPSINKMGVWWLVSIYCLMILPIVFETFTKDPAESQTDMILSPDSMWIILFLPWTEFAANLFKNYDTKVFMVSVTISLALGSSVAMYRNFRKPIVYVFSFLWALIVSIIVVFAFVPSLSGSVDVAPVALINLPKDTPVSVFVEINNVLLGITTPPVPSANQQSFVTTTGFYISVGASCFFGSLVGALIGSSSLFILLLEAPFFYYSVLQFLFGDREMGLYFFRRIVSFDEWRKARWWGETKIYDLIGKDYPNEILDVILSQLFHTARHDYLLKQMPKYLAKASSEKCIETFIGLLPFAEFENINKDLTPRISSLENYHYYQLLSTIYSKRINFYEELSNSYLEYPEFDVSTIQSFLYLANIPKDIKPAQRNAVRVSKIFTPFLHIEHIEFFVALAKATELSLSASSCDQFGNSLDAWINLQEAIARDELFIYLLPFVSQFVQYSTAFREENERADDITQKGLGEAALRSLYLRIGLDGTNNAKRFGLDVIKLVSTHWEKLLIDNVRQYWTSYN